MLGLMEIQERCEEFARIVSYLLENYVDGETVIIPKDWMEKSRQGGIIVNINTKDGSYLVKHFETDKDMESFKSAFRNDDQKNNSLEKVKQKLQEIMELI